MKIIVWILAAVCGYLVGCANLAIPLSRVIYHQDIRQLGSGNPGFTNFKRVFGGKYAWFVFAFDLLKGGAVCLVFGLRFRALGFDFQLGAAFTGLFAMLGHSFPATFGFKGGKGFLVLLSELFVIDWRAGLIAFLVMAALVLTLKYMSLATMSGLALGAVCLFLFGAIVPAAVLYALCVAFMIWRHKENIRRLIKGTESKFSLSGRR